MSGRNLSWFYSTRTINSTPFIDILKVKPTLYNTKH